MSFINSFHVAIMEIFKDSIHSVQKNKMKWKKNPPQGSNFGIPVISIRKVIGNFVQITSSSIEKEL